MGRVVIVGLDGATFDVIQPLVEQGRLPNLARMMREGAWGTLRSTDADQRLLGRGCRPGGRAVAGAGVSVAR